jgi:predicted transcriptional regulator
MNDWTEGYVSGLEYLYGFQPELSPLRVQLALLGAGLAPPRITTACELGFGQGLSMNIHAAAQAVHWYGTDFNPAHVGFARDLAAASGADVQLHDESFAEFCTRQDLPEFDLVALHGVWSWIGDDNQALIVDFLRRKLKVGGVAHISYNVQPGFSALIPLHPLLIGHAAALGRASEGLASRVDAALGFAERVLAVSPAYANSHPQVINLLRSIRREDRRYLAHEYLNANWTPTCFTRVAAALAAAKLEYACSPSLQQTPEGFELTAEQRALLGEIPDTSYREVVRDLMVKRSFRIDYWVKGARRLAPMERIERLLAERVILIREAAEVLPAFASALATAGALHPTLGALIEALADHRPRALAEIVAAVEGRDIAVPQLCEAVGALASLGAVMPVQDEAAARAARPRTDKLNALLCAKALRGADVRVLASPVTGTGFAEVGGRIALFFLHAVARGLREPRDLGAQALKIFRALGIGLLRDGRPIESAEESLALVTGQAQYFLDRQLPVLRAMQIGVPM